MNRRIHRWRFFVTDAWDEMKHSPAVNLLAVATLSASLFVAGITVLVISNVSNHVERLRTEIRLDLYLVDAVASEEIDALREEIEATPGVARVGFVDEREALERYRTWAGEMAELIGELEENPLPASLEVFLDPAGAPEQVGADLAARFGDHPAVDDLRFDRDWISRLESMLRVARVGGLGLVAVVLAAVVLVVSGVLRLAVYARRDEIEIMQLVGATPAFVRGPFLVAGLAHGVVAAGLALLAVEAVRSLGLAYAGRAGLPLLELLTRAAVPGGWAVLLVLTGLTVGACGSWVAARHRF